MEEKPEQMEVFEIETAQPKRESKKKTDKKIILFLVVLSIMWSFVIYLLVKIIMNISYINKEKSDIEINKKELEIANTKYEELLKKKDELSKAIINYNERISTINSKNQQKMDNLIQKRMKPN